MKNRSTKRAPKVAYRWPEVIVANQRNTEAENRLYRIGNPYKVNERTYGTTNQRVKKINRRIEEVANEGTGVEKFHPYNKHYRKLNCHHKPCRKFKPHKLITMGDGTQVVRVTEKQPIEEQDTLCSKIY